MNPANRYYSQDQSIRFVMTTPEEESALFDWAKSGSIPSDNLMFVSGNPAFELIITPDDAREFLIKNHLLFAMEFAKRTVRGNLPFNELVSAANFAVVKAFETFNPKFGNRFTTYLRPFIFGEIQTLWRSKFNSFGIPDPSIMGGGGNQSQIRPATVLSEGGELGEPRGGIQGVRSAVEWEEARYGHEDHPGEHLDLREFNREKLLEILGTLGPEDSELVRRHYFEGLSFAGIARQRGITRKGVSIAHKRLLARLKKSLKSRVEEIV